MKAPVKAIIQTAASILLLAAGLGCAASGPLEVTYYYLPG